MADHSYDAQTDLSFNGHAQRILQLAKQLELESFSIIGHDSGATIARMAAAAQPKRVAKLVLLNTEIPHHRPPFVPMYQQLLKLPVRRIMRAMFKSQWLLKSKLGFGGSFYDKNHITPEFQNLFVNDWMHDPKRFKGLAAYLTGLNFNDIDQLDAVHAKVTAPMLFILGREDKTFPAQLGKAMAKTIPTCEGFVEIPEAAFLVHEEQPELVAEHALKFLLP